MYCWIIFSPLQVPKKLSQVSLLNIKYNTLIYHPIGCELIVHAIPVQNSFKFLSDIKAFIPADAPIV
jgi:hypothetical protein